VNSLSRFEVLITEVLLARTRADAVEGMIVEFLAKYSGPSNLADARLEDLQDSLRPLGLFHKRAKALKGLGTGLLEDFDGLGEERLPRRWGRPGASENGRYVNSARQTPLMLPICPWPAAWAKKSSGNGEENESLARGKRRPQLNTRTPRRQRRPTARKEASRGPLRLVTLPNHSR